MLKSKQGAGNFLMNNAVIILLIVASLAVGVMRPAFFSPANAKNLISNTAIRFIIALGVSGCLISKGTDLSAGRAVGLAACLSATFLQTVGYSGKLYPELGDIPMLLVLLGVVLITALFGLLNGAIISYLKVPPFITTLGTQTIIYGICLVYTKAQPIGGLRTDYTSIASGFLFKDQNIPFLKTIGGNESAAEVSGINTKATKMVIYSLAGLLYGVAGFLLAPKAGGTSVNAGFGYELEAIAGCTIGGVSTNGGVGRVVGILIGVLVFELLKIAMMFMGVEPSYTYIVQGIVIVLAVSLDMRKYAAKK